MEFHPGITAESRGSVCADTRWDDWQRLSPLGRRRIFSPDLEMVKIYQPSLFLLAAGLAVEILEWGVGCK